MAKDKKKDKSKAKDKAKATKKLDANTNGKTKKEEKAKKSLVPKREKPPMPNGQWTVDLRPESLSSLLLPAHTKTTIKQIIERKPHTIMITGSSGLGKTSLAHIIAAKLTENSKADVTDFNCAKSTMEEVRALQQKLAYLPRKVGSKRVFIIDEIQALSGPAISTLLGPLEAADMPHAVFILCTDQPGKVKATISSRATKIQLNAPTIEDLAAHLRVVAETAQEIPKGWPSSDLDKLFLACADAGRGNVREAVQATETCLGNINAVGVKTLKETIDKDLMPQLVTGISGDLINDMIKQFSMAPNKRKRVDIQRVVREFIDVGDHLNTITLLIDGCTQWLLSDHKEPESQRTEGMTALLGLALQAKDKHMLVPSSGFNEAKARLTYILMTALTNH